MYTELIKNKGLSVTQKRIALLKGLDVANKPITIEELRAQMTDNMDVSTMYRSLKKLVDAGIVYQTDFRDGVSYFELQGDNHHHHVVCTECKSRKSIDLCVRQNFDAVEKTTGYTVTNHIFELFGLCENCSS